MKIYIKDKAAIEKIKEFDKSCTELVDKVLSAHRQNKLEEVQYEKYSLLRFEDNSVILATMGEANTSVNFRECLMSSVVDEFTGEYTAFRNMYHKLEEDCGSFILLN